MRLCDLDYHLPPERIAQSPATPRDDSRLLVVERATGALQHLRFRDLPGLLRAGDAIVLNDTRVIPARLVGRRKSGGRVEGLFLAPAAEGWRVLLKPSARLRAGEELTLDGGGTLRIVARRERGEWLVAPTPALPPPEFLQRFGHVPLPPYIRGGAAQPNDAERYQTIYAARDGAIAAPTAGLHFTPELLERLRHAGVGRANVTLHVGAGTFAPLEADALCDHVMHSEWRCVDRQAVALLTATRRRDGRIVAVGTTAARVLESLTGELGVSDAESLAVEGMTNLFIYPPFRFRNVDALITNFHLPRSTLLALVMALAGEELTRHVYQTALAQDYRFYSYGDAMMVV